MIAAKEKSIIEEDFDEYYEMVREFKIDRKKFTSLIRYKKGNYIVYIDDIGDFEWVTSDEYDHRIESIDKESAKLRNEMISEVEFIQHKPIKKLMGNDLSMHLTCMLAETFTYILEEDYEVASEHLGKINGFLEERNFELSRKWHVLYSGLATAVAFVSSWLIYFALVYVGFRNKTIINIILFMPFGALGAAISIFQGAKKKEYNCESGALLNIIEVVVRITTGMVAGFLAICLFNLDVVFSIFKDSPHEFEALSVMCFIVGFSERFIPSIVNKFETNDFK